MIFTWCMSGTTWLVKWGTIHVVRNDTLTKWFIASGGYKWRDTAEIRKVFSLNRFLCFITLTNCKKLASFYALFHVIGYNTTICWISERYKSFKANYVHGIEIIDLEVVGQKRKTQFYSSIIGLQIRWLLVHFYWMYFYCHV